MVYYKLSMPSFASQINPASLLHWFTLLIVFLAARLAISMYSKDTMPIFRAYLLALVGALLMLDNRGNAYVELVVLGLKCAATAEILGILCAEAEEREICWLCLFSAGLTGVMCCLLLDFQQQHNLAYADVRSMKHVCQIILLLVTLCVTLFACVVYELKGWPVKHAVIMCGLWGAYVVAGIMAPKTLIEWEWIRVGWAVGAVTCLGCWSWALVKESEGANGCELQRATPQYLLPGEPNEHE